MEETGLAGLIIIAINCIVSYKGFRSRDFTERYIFRVENILLYKDYKRLLTSGFLHANWTHLLFNMLTLYFFSSGIESALGIQGFLLVYFGSLVGGDLFSLFIHRHDPSYSALGASGAVSGIIFASIAIFPGMQISFFFIPIALPAWIYGLAYVLYCIYGIRSRRDHVGHDAHLGGGIVGLLLGIALVPSALLDNYIPILLILVPSCIFIYLIITKPAFLFLDNPFAKPGLHTQDDKYNIRKQDTEKELNALLDKISKKGMDSLSKKEKERLRDISGNRS